MSQSRHVPPVNHQVCIWEKGQWKQKVKAAHESCWLNWQAAAWLLMSHRFMDRVLWTSSVQTRIQAYRWGRIPPVEAETIWDIYMHTVVVLRWTSAGDFSGGGKWIIITSENINGVMNPRVQLWLEFATPASHTLQPHYGSSMKCRRSYDTPFLAEDRVPLCLCNCCNCTTSERSDHEMEDSLSEGLLLLIKEDVKSSRSGLRTVHVHGTSS